jgi:mono/diheme cytochrome c family protein
MRTRRLVIFCLAIAVIALPVAAAGPDGAAIYKSKCQVCHAANGSGDTPAGKSMHVKDLRSDEVQKQTDIELTKTIAGGKGKMPAYGKQLSNDDISALIAHIRTLKP